MFIPASFIGSASNLAWKSMLDRMSLPNWSWVQSVKMPEAQRSRYGFV